MAKSFSASVRDWGNRTKQAQEAILHSSLEDVMAVASVTQESAKTRNGPAQQGAIPRDTGHLVNTVAADLNGSGSFGTDDKNDVTLLINDMKAGDKMHIAWTAAYAHRINSGFVGTDSLGRTFEQGGVHWVETAAEKWDAIVQANAEFLKV